MLKKIQLWMLILLSSFYTGLLTAAPADSDSNQNTKEIETHSNTQVHFEFQETLNPIRLAVNNNLQSKHFTEFEQSLKNKLDKNVIHYYVKLSAKNKARTDNLRGKPTIFNFDYALNSHLNSVQLLSNKPLLGYKKQLVLSTVIQQSPQIVKTYFNNDKKSDASIYNLNEIDRQDLAYIEEELLYSKEAGVSYEYDDTSEAIRLLTFNSLDLDDKSLISMALLLICALVTIAIYTRYFRY